MNNMLKIYLILGLYRPRHRHKFRKCFDTDNFDNFLPLCLILKLQGNVSIITLKWSTCDIFLKLRAEKSNQIVKKHLEIIRELI